MRVIRRDRKVHMHIDPVMLVVALQRARGPHGRGWNTKSLRWVAVLAVTGVDKYATRVPGYYDSPRPYESSKPRIQHLLVRRVGGIGWLVGNGVEIAGEDNRKTGARSEWR